MPEEMSEAAPAAAPAAEATSDPGVSSGGAPPPEADPFDNPEQGTFDRAYVEKLRKEAAGHRTAYQPYRDAFDGYDDESRNWMLSLAQDLKNASDPSVRSRLLANLDTLRKGLSPEEKQAVDGAIQESQADPEADRPLTRAELEKAFEERERWQKQEKEIRAVYDEAKALGYDVQFDAKGNLVQNRDLADLLFRATHETQGDLQKAHEARAEAAQAVIDAFVKSQQEGASQAPILTGSGGAPDPAQGVGQPTTLKEARERMLKRVRG